jgi:hypothetical protein
MYSPTRKASSDGDADDTKPCKQRADVETEGRKGGDDGDDRKPDQQGIAHQRQQGVEPRGRAGALVLVAG